MFCSSSRDHCPMPGTLTPGPHPNPCFYRYWRGIESRAQKFVRLEQSELPEICRVFDDEITGEMRDVGVLSGVDAFAKPDRGQEGTVVRMLRIAVRVQ